MDIRKQKIRFRGRRKLNGNWIYGSYIHVGDDWCQIVRPGTGYDEIKYEMTRVITDTVGQFTGLKDAANVDIYEDDLLREKDGMIWRVMYWRAAFWFVNVEDDSNLNTYDWLISTKYRGSSFWEAGEYKVIGNAFENPDLLKQ